MPEHINYKLCKTQTSKYSYEDENPYLDKNKRALAQGENALQMQEEVTETVTQETDDDVRRISVLERPQLPEPLDLGRIRSKAMEEVMIAEQKDDPQVDFETILAMSPEYIVKDGEIKKPAMWLE